MQIAFGIWHRLAVVLRHRDGEETRIGRTVDALAQRAQQIAKTVFAAVHVGSPVPALVRVHVGNEDFGQMHLVGDRAPARAVTRLDHRKHGPRPHVGPQVKAPHVPDEAAFLDCDVVPAGLGKACRFGFRPQRAARGDFGLVITPGFSRRPARMPVSITSIALPVFRSTVANRPSIGRAQTLESLRLGVARDFQETLALFFLAAEIS